MAKQKCTCDKHHDVNGHHKDGTAIVMWTCPVHGSLFREEPLGVSLTRVEKAVYEIVLAGQKSGTAPTADEISKATNYTVNQVEITIKRLEYFNLAKVR